MKQCYVTELILPINLRERGLNIKKRRKVCSSGAIVAEYYL